MKIVVTGSSGFVGSLLVKRLEEKGHEVLGVDLPMDITDSSYLNREPTEIDVMIHLAGLSTDKACKADPYECARVNILGTLNVLRMAQMCKCKQFIFASSEWVYGESLEEKGEGAFINTMALGEYALSKHVSEVNLLQNFMKTNLITTIFRFGIIYGPRDKNWSVVETLFNEVKNKDSVMVKSIETGRNYVHVEDVVSGIIASLGMNGFHIVNLTGDKFINLRDIISTSEEILGKKVETFGDPLAAPSIRKVSNMKAKMIMNWKPEYDLKKGLETLL